MIDLYFAPTPNGRRAAIMLGETGLPHTVHRVSFANKPAALLERNPSGFIPVIEDPDGPDGKPIVIVQSGAIMLYLAEKTGRFIPTDPRQRLLVMQRFMFTSSDLASGSSPIFAARNDVAEPHEPTIKMFEDRLVKFFRMADAYLAGRDYLADAISIADFGLYPFYIGRKALADEAGGMDNLSRWADRIGARPAVAEAMAIKRAE